MKRDFTYIDDIVKGIINVMHHPAEPEKDWSGKNPDPSRSTAPYRLYNIGNNKPVELLSFIKDLERCMDKEAVLQMKEIQAGDVTTTWADIEDLEMNYGYQPNTSTKEGIQKFVSWIKNFHKL